MHRLSEVQPCPMPTYANQKGKNSTHFFAHKATICSYLWKSKCHIFDTCISIVINLLFLQYGLPYPHTFSEIRFTSCSFAHCCSTVSLLPIAQEAKPHCGESERRSNGMYLAASWMRAITSSSSSSSGRFVVISPSTTCLSGLTFAKGSKPPERSSSYSRYSTSTFSRAKAQSATES